MLCNVGAKRQLQTSTADVNCTRWDTVKHIHVRINLTASRISGSVRLPQASGLRTQRSLRYRQAWVLTGFPKHTYGSPKPGINDGYLKRPRSTGTNLRSYRCRCSTSQPEPQWQTNMGMHVCPKHKEQNVPFDKFLASPHFLEQRGITYDSRRVLDLAARLIQTRNDPHNRALHDIRQVCNAVERHAAGPLVDDLNHAETRLGDKVVGVVCG